VAIRRRPEPAREDAAVRRPARRSRSADLNGSAPDNCPVALLVIDAINHFVFEDSDAVLADARRMAAPLSALKTRAARAGVPVVYVNDNFGRWRSDFRTLVAHCSGRGARGGAVARALRPARDDYFVLKPKHSGFYATCLDLLLEHLGAETVILTGLLTDICVLFTANDAYVRGLRVVVPSDCVAARSRADSARALAVMRRALGAETPRAAEIDLDALAAPGRAPRPR
jgi:nicotinamidase-related amidase